MSEWITDRLPTEADADLNGCVLLTYKKEIHLADWDTIQRDDAWMPCPEPYRPPQPPEPDTSLSASIKRLESYNSEAWKNEGAEPLPVDENHNPHGVTNLFGDDLARVLYAAKKGGEHECGMESLKIDYSKNRVRVGEPKPAKPRTVPLEDFQQRDPDGVGEGWRRLREDEVIKEGDQYMGDKSIAPYYEPNEWTEVGRIRIGGKQVGKTLVYRRRIRREYVRYKLDEPEIEQRVVHTGKPTHVSAIGCWCLRTNGEWLLICDPMDKIPDDVIAFTDRIDGEEKPPGILLKWRPDQDKPTQREWWMKRGTLGWRVAYGKPSETELNADDYTHVREVLPDDPDPDWVDELIQLCESSIGALREDGYYRIVSLLGERGEK